MARVNRNASYIFDVDGETVWEKLKSIRSMLDDRKRAYQHAILAKEKSETLDKDSFEYKKYLIDKDFNDGLIQDCVNEIKFLEEFESYLSKEAEKTRIPGKTDDEMYEINFFEELKTRLVRKAQAQIITTGRISDDILLRIAKNKDALNTCIEQGLLSKEINKVLDTKLLTNSNIHTNDYFLITKQKD
jgi:hypothetical protein